MVAVLEIINERLLTNEELAKKDSQYKESCKKYGINHHKTSITITEGKLLIIDPIYLADIYNESGKKEEYLTINGVIMNEFGGDLSGPMFKTRCDGLKILLAFDNIDENGNYLFDDTLIDEIEASYIESDNLYCDSGTYIFLDYNKELRRIFKEELEENNLMIVDLQNGEYIVAYEQWEPNEVVNEEYLRRNLVVKSKK